LKFIVVIGYNLNVFRVGELAIVLKSSDDI